VRLLDQPVKVGRLNGELLVESHEPLEEDELPMKVTLEQAEKAVIAKVGPDMAGVDQAALRAAVEQVSGMPVSISMEPGSSTSLPIGQPTAPPHRSTHRAAPRPQLSDRQSDAFCLSGQPTRTARPSSLDRVDRVDWLHLDSSDR